MWTTLEQRTLDQNIFFMIKQLRHMDLPSKHKTFSQCCFNFGLHSVSRHQTNVVLRLPYIMRRSIGLTFRVLLVTLENFWSGQELKGPYPGKWHVFVLALLYLFECLNE